MAWDRDTLWRQGLLLPGNAVSALGLCHPNGPDETRVLVITHDCDLAQDPTLEPNVEVIVGCTIPKLEGNHSHAKHSRRLHLEFEGAQPGLVQLDAKDKVILTKSSLTGFEPSRDPRLSPEGLKTLQLWLASRYRRSAFPDEFENRLKQKACGELARKISKLLRPYGDLISGIFFDVDGGEVEVRHEGPDDPYTLDILILHPAAPDFLAAEKAAETLAKAIKDAFVEKLFNPTKTWKYIELRSCEPVSESVLTYDEFKILNRWRFEHISLGSDPQQEPLAE